jgi:hypothetical protein
MTEKCLFSSLPGTRTSSIHCGQRAWNLPSRLVVPQYSTPNESHRADRGIAPSDPRRKNENDAIPSGLHAGERVVKPHGTSMNRTSSAASDAPAGTTRNSRAGNRGVFQNPPPPDGPRTPPPAALRTLPPAGAYVRGSDRPAGGGTPCPARSPDTAVPPATRTNAAPSLGRLRYSTAPGDAGAKTASCTPSEDRSVHGNGPGLAVVTVCNHAQEEPRELLLPTVKSRGGAAYSAPGRL